MKEPKSLFAKLRKVSLIVLILGILLALALASISEALAKPQILAQLEQRFGGEASLDELDVSMLGKVVMRGLRASDANGDEVLRIDELKASCSLTSLLSFYPELGGLLTGFELTLRQLPDESWNFEAWSGETDENAGASEPREQEAAAEADRLPFHGGFSLADGRIHLIARDGTSVIHEISGRASVEEGTPKLTMELQASLQPSQSLRDSAGLEASVGLMGNLTGDLARGPMAAQWKFELGLANGDGRLKLGGLLESEVLLGKGPADANATGLSLSLNASSLGLNAKIMPLLAMLHPVFQSAASLDSSAMSGLLDGELNLAYRGSMNPQDDLWSWLGSSLAAISGDGSLAIDGAQLGDIPMLQEMFSYLGLKGRELNLDPMSFRIEQGQVTYKEGWGWKVGGIKTSFEGSVGLDGSLNLSWNAPVTDAAVAKYSFLKHLRGKTIGIPVSGSMAHPVFEFQGALESVGSKLVKDKLLGELGLEELPGLDDLGSLGLERLGLGSQPAGAENPSELFKRANRLWDAGDKAQAALLYGKIRAEHKATITYTLNRSRIKRRAKYEG